MLTKTNIKIRNALKLKNMKQWQLAEILGISENTLYRMLRKELPEEEQNRIVTIIAKGGCIG